MVQRISETDPTDSCWRDLRAKETDGWRLATEVLRMVLQRKMRYK